MASFIRLNFFLNKLKVCFIIFPNKANQVLKNAPSKASRSGTIGNSYSPTTSKANQVP